MKKIVFLFVMLTFLILAACVPDNPGVDRETELDNIKKWIHLTLPEAVNEDLELPTSHPNIGGEITWMSTDLTALLDDGSFVLEKGTREVTLMFKITLMGKELSGTINVWATAVSFDDIAERFENQFDSTLIAGDYTVNTSYENNIYTITWTSSKPEYFSNEGKFNAPEFSEEVTINFTVTRGDKSEDYSFTRLLNERTSEDKAREVREWVINNYLPNRVVGENVQLPSKFTKIRNDKVAWEIDIEWFSSNYNVISKDGKITRYGFDRYVNLIGAFKILDSNKTIQFDLVVPAKELLTKEEKINSFLEAIAVSEIERKVFSGYANITQTYNMLNFYERQNYMEILEKKIVPEGKSKRNTGKIPKVEFITIHDTANVNVGALGHANLQYNGYDAASWHFQVDDYGAIQSIPLNEIAHHAGDGTATGFGLNDTGVKANGVLYPIITVESDGYYYLNGEKSQIKAPRIAKIAPAGIYTEIGANGNYYINNTYYNSDFGYISNRGGNRNSIGIETCINYGSDYGTTLRYTAILVAEMLIQFDLGVSRVMQHNNFSGKHCPRAIIDTNHWSEFLDLISLEKYAKEHISDVDFTWTSNSVELANDGRININSTAGTEISYSVHATDGNLSINKTFTTTLR